MHQPFKPHLRCPRWSPLPMCWQLNAPLRPTGSASTYLVPRSCLRSLVRGCHALILWGLPPPFRVGLEGSPPYPVFFLEFTGFVVPPGYVGVDGKPDGHVTLEARPTADSPPKPCIGGTFLGTVKVGIWMTKEYICPNDSLRVEREAQHGEGAYVGHLVLEWQVSGTQFIISAHGHTTANLALLKRLGGSIEMTAPR